MNKLEIKKIEVSIDRSKLAKKELELKLLEIDEEKARIVAQVVEHDSRIKQLEDILTKEN